MHKSDKDYIRSLKVLSIDELVNKLQWAADGLASLLKRRKLTSACAEVRCMNHIAEQLEEKMSTVDAIALNEGDVRAMAE